MTTTVPSLTRHQTLQGLGDLLMALESARDEAHYLRAYPAWEAQIGALADRVEDEMARVEDALADDACERGGGAMGEHIEVSGEFLPPYTVEVFLGGKVACQVKAVPGLTVTVLPPEHRTTPEERVAVNAHFARVYPTDARPFPEEG